MGEQHVSFVPSKKSSKKAQMREGVDHDAGRGQRGIAKDKGRRSASGNVMRQL